jgi:hypothetical protein
VAGALHHDHGLHGRRTPGETGELAGVADRFEIQQDHIGVGVLVPVLQKVVAGHIRAVARGDEGGQAGTAPVQPGEQGDADRAGLGEQADAAGGRGLGSQRGIEADGVRGADDAEGVRADDAHPVRAGLPHELALALSARGTALGVSGGQDHQALDAVLAAVGHHVRHPLGRNGDDGEIDGLPDLADGTEGGDAVHLALVLQEGAVHGVRTACEPGMKKVAQYGAADAAGRAAGADDGDRTGHEEALHGTGLGPLLASALDREGLLGRFQVEGQMDRAVLEAAPLGVAGILEDLDHLAVGGQHLGSEAPDAALARHRRDVLEESGGDTATLMGVLDEEGDLGLVGGGARRPALRVDPVVADGGDELATHRDRETHPVDVVVMGEAVHVLVGEPGVGREESVVLRLVGDLLVEAHQAFGITGGDGPDARRAAVAQHHVGFPVAGVSVIRRGLHGKSLRPARRSRRRLTRAVRGRRMGSLLRA